MSQRIAVLGAGPMGLAVAYQLARDGHRPVVFEADDRVGCGYELPAACRWQFMLFLVMAESHPERLLDSA